MWSLGTPRLPVKPWYCTISGYFSFPINSGTTSQPWMRVASKPLYSTSYTATAFAG